VGWRAEGATEEAKAAEALGPCLVETEGGEGARAVVDSVALMAAVGKEAARVAVAMGVATGEGGREAVVMEVVGWEAGWEAAEKAAG
jgi:hypothetical protein